MRIRRSASKLLGLATTQPASSPRWSASSELAAASASAVDAAAGMFCQLNCSPWDAMPNLQLAMFFQEEEEEEGRGGGLLGHGFEVKEEMYENSTATATHSESNLKGDEGLEDAKMIKKKKASKGKGKGKGKKNQIDKGRHATADVDRRVACKKTDGKGWHCKRPAQHPHSLCQYHLSQLRNYGAGQSNSASTEVSGEGKQSTRSRKKSNTSGAADGNFYYYYSGFGPWRGKTRGGVSAGREGANEAESGTGSSKVSECADANEDCDDAPVAGEDECALDEEDDEGEGCADVNCAEDNGEGKAKMKAKKRGRKPVKARSLKSLL